MIGLASNFTVQQFLVRENFALRFEKGEPIWLHEFFYALMQGYDAVAMQHRHPDRRHRPALQPDRRPEADGERSGCGRRRS